MISPLEVVVSRAMADKVVDLAAPFLPKRQKILPWQKE